MEIELTKDSNKVLLLLYKEYLEKVKSGCSKSQSREFNENNLDFITKMHPDDIDDCLSELNKSNLIEMEISGDFELTDNAVVYLNNRFKNSFKNGLNNIKDVLSLISQFVW